MDQRRRIGGCRWVLLLVCATLLAPLPVRGDDGGLLESFRRAIRIHGSLLCGHHPDQGLFVRYVVEPRPGQPLSVARDRMMEVLRRRLEDWGEPTPSITFGGEGGIDVWFPGSTPRAQVMRGVLERPGILAFHAVDTTSLWFEAVGPAMDRWGTTLDDTTVTVERGYDDVVIRAKTREELEAFAATLPEPPAKRILGFQEEEHWESGAERAPRWRLFLLHADAPVHGGHIASASATTDEHDGMPRISLEFSDAGAIAFADLSEALVQRYLAIVLDGRVMSAPKVMERIGGGRAEITLGSGRSYHEFFEEARALAVVLGSGGHPAGLRRISEDTGGPLPVEGWRALGPLPFTAQAVALLLIFRYGCF